MKLGGRTSYRRATAQECRYKQYEKDSDHHFATSQEEALVHNAYTSALKRGVGGVIGTPVPRISRPVNMAKKDLRQINQLWGLT